jgi:uncharacterized protein YjbI with pentapeptide repeats
VPSVQELDPLSSGDSVTHAQRRRLVQRLFGGVALVVTAVVVVGFVVYIVNADGAARISALFAGGLVLISVWLLLWSYIRRPPLGQDDDFLDKFLASIGQALLLGALLSFGFGIIGQRLENEQKARDNQLAAEQAAVDLRRDLAGQVRTDAGGKSFRGVDLEEQSFVGLNLSGFDLSEADLSHADLTDADLTDADLTDADLTDADLTAAHLSGADLPLADLSHADLSGANLSGAFLGVADLSDADLTAAHLSGADLSGADLSGADLTEADLTEAFLTEADLTGAHLTGAWLTRAIYDANTVWPNGFEPPPTAVLVE